MKIDNPPIPPLEKGGWGDLEAIFHVIPISQCPNTQTHIENSHFSILVIEILVVIWLLVLGICLLCSMPYAVCVDLGPWQAFTQTPQILWLKWRVLAKVLNCS